MALDIFAAEFGEPAVTPNALRMGKDGGVDGFFDGSIEGVAGPWKIAVAVRQDFGAAKQKVKHENALAREADHRALFFITSYATPVETAELTRLARVGLKGARVWARNKLGRVLRDHTWIRQVYFGHQIVPGLVPVGHPSELDDPNQPDLELVGRATEADNVRAFIDGTARILVVVAAGGSGKTRFLRALPDLARGVVPRRSVWLRRPGQGTLNEAFLNGLPSRKPLMIVLDDAAQSPADTAELARLAVDPSIVDVKLVLSIRSVDREAVAGMLARVHDFVAWIDLTELSVTDAARIATLECPTLSSNDATRVARTFGSNLFLLRAAAQQIRRGEQPDTVVNNEHIRRLIATRLIEESQRYASSIADQGQTVRLLSKCALSAPLEFAETVKSEALAALYHAGVLRRVGNTLRFRRDVEGDLLLAYLVEQPAPRAMIEQAFNACVDGDELRRQLRNLGAAGRGHAATMIRNLLQGWNFDGTANSERIALLPYCAEAAPEQVSDIAITAAHGRQLLASDVASIAIALGGTDAAQGLRFVWQVAALDVTFEVNNVLPQLLNPWFHGPDELSACCALLERWLDEPIVGRRDEVLAVALSSMLATVARWNSYDGASFTIHEQPLPPSRELLNIRRIAVRVLGKMLSHSEDSIRRRAAAVLGRHGAPHIGRASGRGFKGAASDEFQSLVPIIESRFANETEIDIVSAIYSGLATRWAAGWSGSDAAGQLLVGRQIDPAIKAFQYSSRDEWFYDFDEAFRAAPHEERWRWWVERYHFNRSESECARLVSDLSARYRSIGDVAVCVSMLARAVRPEWIIMAWCRSEPVLFAQALPEISDARARRLIEDALERERYRIDESAALADLHLLPQPVTQGDVARLINRATLNDVTLALSVARWLVDQQDVSVRRQGLECIQHRDDGDPGACLDILEHALRDGDWGNHWDIILYVLDKPERRRLVGQHPRLIQHIEERFRVGKDWSGDDWHESQVFSILYGDDYERWLDLIGHLVRPGAFGAIQEVGHLLGPLLLSRKTFRTVVDRLIRWARELGKRGLSTIESIMYAIALEDAELPQETLPTALELLRGDDVTARGVALLLLAELKPTVEVCSLLARIATDPNDASQERASSALSSYQSPRRGWSRSIGQPSGEMTNILNVLRQAREHVSGEARALVGKMLAYVEESIAEEARSDEEVLDPR